MAQMRVHTTDAVICEPYHVQYRVLSHGYAADSRYTRRPVIPPAICFEAGAAPILAQDLMAAWGYIKL
jgi:hypothetical protein